MGREGRLQVGRRCKGVKAEMEGGMEGEGGWAEWLAEQVGVYQQEDREDLGFGWERVRKIFCCQRTSNEHNVPALGDFVLLRMMSVEFQQINNTYVRDSRDSSAAANVSPTVL